MTYPFLPISTVLRHLPDMERLGVSVVARSPRGFVSAYRRAGVASRLPMDWQVKRLGFIARHMAQYRERPTYRRWLALAAWAYKPPGRQPKEQ